MSTNKKQKEPAVEVDSRSIEYAKIEASRLRRLKKKARKLYKLRQQIARENQAKALQEMRAPANRFRIRFRHVAFAISFLALVALPIVLSVYYLYWVAADQYASRVGFSVRSENAPSQAELLGGLSALTGSGSVTKDSDVLYAFIRSQQLVRDIDDEIDLKGLFSKPEYDPVFAFDPNGSIEDLQKYWQRMVKVYYDSATGLIELRVNAFDPNDARLIASSIFYESADLVNRLSAIARDDTTSYAQEELIKSQDELRAARQAITQFRNENQILDPSADVAGQMGILNSLQTQLAEAYIEFDTLAEVTRADDPRVSQVERKIAVIEKRITEERKKFGIGETEDNPAFSNLVAQYEALTVDREFAEQAYLAARTTYSGAVAEAGRQSRYLAAYIEPTLAERAEFPSKILLICLVCLFSLLGWAILMLIAYSIKDRK